MRDIQTKTDGVSTLPASQYNANLLNELQNAVESVGITLDPEGGADTNLFMLAQTLATYALDGGFYQDSGTANTYVLSKIIATFKSPEDYFNGMSVSFVVGNTNTGVSTINVAGLGAKSLKSAGSLALKLGDLPKGAVVSARYNGTDFIIESVARPQTSGDNLLLNSKFNINQREVSGAVVLGAGVYGHDRWKGGSGGCSYTFAQALGVTTITISAGTLVQEVDGDNVISGDHVLSWTGTAQAQVDGGGYGDTGEVVETLVGGTNAVIEFGTGTVLKTQLEFGTIPSSFKNLSGEIDLDKCQDYFERIKADVNQISFGVGQTRISTIGDVNISYSEKRIIPSVSLSSTASEFAIFHRQTHTACTNTSVVGGSVGRKSCRVTGTTASVLTAGEGVQLTANTTTNPYIDIDAEI